MHVVSVCCISVYVKTEGHTVTAMSEEGALGFFYSVLEHFASPSAYQNKILKAAFSLIEWISPCCQLPLVQVSSSSRSEDPGRGGF